MKDDLDNVVCVSVGYSKPDNKHIPGQTYMYGEGYFSSQEAKRDAKIKLLEKYPNARHVRAHSYLDKNGLTAKQGHWYAEAFGYIQDNTSEDKSSKDINHEDIKQLVVYSNSNEYNHMFKAFEVALRESTRLTKKYNLEIDYIDSTVDDYIDPKDAIESDEHTIVKKAGIKIDTASSYYGIKIAFRKSN